MTEELPSDESIDRVVQFINSVAEKEGIGFWDVLMKIPDDPEYSTNLIEKAKQFKEIQES